MMATLTPADRLRRVLREMVARRAVDAIGQLGFTLVATIAAIEHDEDEPRWVIIGNGDLMAATGIATRTCLRSTRDRCVAAGWLTYKYRGTRQPGVYSTAIPSATFHVVPLAANSAPNGGG